MKKFVHQLIVSALATIATPLFADVTITSDDPTYTSIGTTPISVAADNIWRFPRLVIYPNSLTKEGDGVLEVGFFQSATNPFDYDSTTGMWGVDFEGDPVSVRVNGGTFSVMATQRVDLAAIVTTPTLHFDASDASTMTTVEEDGKTRLSEWRDPVSGKTAVAPYSENYGAAKPWVVANALNGKSVVDFGAFVQAINGKVIRPDTGEEDWDSIAYHDLSSSASLKYPDVTMREVFVVLRVKERRKQPFIFGSVYSGVYSFSPVEWGALCASPSAELLNGEWRVDGLKVDQTSFVPDQEFHLLSISLKDNSIGGLNTFTQDRHCRVGGMELAEVVVYDTELGTDERSAIEKHLMAKWLNKPHPHEAATTLGSLSFGDGISPSLEAGRDVTVQYINGSGTFTKSGAGDVTAYGVSDTITGFAVESGALAFMSAGNALDVTNEAFFCIDPSNPSTLTKNGDCVTRIDDARSSGTRYATTSAGSTALGPTLVASPTGLDLLDFGTFAYTKDASADDTCGMIWSERKQVYTVCAVIEKKSDHDSFLLGDTDAYEFHADDGNMLSTNYSDNKLRPGNSDYDAVWTLDGVTVNPLTTTWPSGLHVITVSIRDTRSDGLHMNGAWAGMFSQDRQLCRIGGMRYGEVFVFDKTISSAKVAALSAYLREKWIGGEKDTSSGLQSLSVASGASLSYDGDITVADGSTVEIGYGSQGRSGTISVGGDVLLGRNVEVSVADGRGEVAVISADSFANTAALSTWTLNGKTGKLYVRGDVLYARCGGGMMIMIR